ncbi:FliG C-terminal domain-containing protein [Jannaschia sp. CCS1]|uniref:FliG C-terminal domain-containing protein n=1 Tax=Jannaschia sp. (strain CCS1) TaxID=290400 RepID=UPI000053AA49|nr:FliG C-terminal domain-containing protein [Jannaschia sp. CCS1]ABD55581.1 flagellar motor switch protein FliG [Jannaschia sp. CCS1]
MDMLRDADGGFAAMTLDSETPGATTARAMKDVTPRRMGPQQKAAVIVRLLLGQGVSPGVQRLAPHHQTRLAHVISQLEAVDRQTLLEVVKEFTQRIDNLALSFPSGLDETLDLLEPHLGEGALSALRLAAERSDGQDPWVRIAKQPVTRLAPLLESESAEVCAVLLSKLTVAKAAELLSELPEDRGQILAHTVALTETITPDLVERIGVHIAQVLESVPAQAFPKTAAERVGAILNSTPQAARDKMLEGLNTRDAPFAKEVRKSIFSFAHIPMRVEPTDVPIIVRKADAKSITVAFAAGLSTAPLSVEFMLENMSKRLAEQMRDDAEGLGTPKPEEGEAAMADLIRTIRDLEASGDLQLLPPVD